MISLNEINTLNGLAELEKPWGELLAKSSNNNIFLTWTWVSRWWAAFGVNNRLTVFAGYDNNGALVGIAPLMITQEKSLFGTLKVVSLIGSGCKSLPDHLGFIICEGNEYEFNNAVFAVLKERETVWDVVHLSDMLEDSRLQGSAAAVFNGSHKCQVLKTGISPFIQLPETWDGFLGKLSRKWRYRIKEYERAFKDDYPFEFLMVDDQSALAKEMGAFEALHKQRMKEKGLTGPSLEPDFWKFHNALAKQLLPDGKLFLGLLKVDGRMIACNYNFVHDGKVYYYQSGLDTKFSKYSVGFILNSYMIRESIKRGFSEFDFLRGDENYKFHFTKQYRNNIEVIIWGNSVKSRAARALFILKRNTAAFCGRIKCIFRDPKREHDTY